MKNPSADGEAAVVANVAPNSDILDPFPFPSPVQGTKESWIIRPIRFQRLETKGSRIRGRDTPPSGVVGGAKCSEPRPFPVAPGNPGL